MQPTIYCTAVTDQALLAELRAIPSYFNPRQCARAVREVAQRLGANEYRAHMMFTARVAPTR